MKHKVLTKILYMLLKRNELFMEVVNERIFEISEKLIKTLSKINIKEILEIVDAKKSVIVAKEIEVNLSGNPKDRTPEIEKIIDNKLKKYTC